LVSLETPAKPAKPTVVTRVEDATTSTPKASTATIATAAALDDLFARASPASVPDATTAGGADQTADPLASVDIAAYIAQNAAVQKRGLFE